MLQSVARHEDERPTSAHEPSTIAHRGTAAQCGHCHTEWSTRTLARPTARKSSISLQRRRLLYVSAVCMPIAMRICISLYSYYSC